MTPLRALLRCCGLLRAVANDALKSSIPIPSRFIAWGLGWIAISAITLTRNGNSVNVTALVDSGSTLNVLPYDVGAQLGADGDRQRVHMKLTGTLSNVEARAILLSATVGGFAPVQLAFAWTRSTDTGQFLHGI